MNRLTRLAVLLLALVASSAVAQRAIIIELPSGQLIGVAYTPTGQIVLTDVQLIRVPKPPDPPPPTPVTTGPVWTIVIRTVDTMTADQSQVLSDLRQWSDDQPPGKVGHLEFPPDAVGPSGDRDAKVATWVAKIPPNAKQPYLFISQNKADGTGAQIFWQGELPAKADDVIAKIKERVK